MIVDKQFPAGIHSGNMVEIRDLTRRYGTFEAVRGLSLSIQGGEIFGLLGPNGLKRT